MNLWYSLCTGRGRYVPPGLDFCAGRAILLLGHKNRGAERLRSAFCGVPFYQTGQCRRGSLQNCPFFHKPRAPAGKRAHFVFVYYRSEKRNPYDQNLFQDPHSGGGCADDRPVHRFEHDPDPAHAPRRFHHPVQHGAHSGNELPPRRKVGHHDRFRQQPDPACAGPWQSGILPDPHGTGGLRAAGLPSGLHGAGLCLPDCKAFPQPHRGCRCQRLCGVPAALFVQLSVRLHRLEGLRLRFQLDDRDRLSRHLQHERGRSVLAVQCRVQRHLHAARSHSDHGPCGDPDPCRTADLRPAERKSVSFFAVIFPAGAIRRACFMATLNPLRGRGRSRRVCLPR